VILRTTKNKVTKETTVAAVGSVHPSALPAYPDLPDALAGLQAFRTGLHACCTRRADALVDLADALLSAPGPVASLPQLSLERDIRRLWSSAGHSHGHSTSRYDLDEAGLAVQGPGSELPRWRSL
jgi:hypothetical protein